MTELEQCRQELDALDEQLTRLFCRRMEITGRVGRYKRERGIPVLDPQRERQLLAAKAALVADPERKEDVTELFRAILAISRRRQREQTERERP